MAFPKIYPPSVSKLSADGTQKDNRQSTKGTEKQTTKNVQLERMKDGKF